MVRLVNLLEHELRYTLYHSISIRFDDFLQHWWLQRMLPNAARAELNFMQMRTKVRSEEIPTRNKQLISSTISSNLIAFTVNTALLVSLSGSRSLNS